jgi:ubiquinol-cytochrome c reductase cytochrome b subunit
VIAGRILTAYYFAFLLIILPLLGLFEKTKPLPNSISEAVLREGIPIGASAPPPSSGGRA